MKFYRIYFNRASEQPQVWSIDEGNQTTEINVCAVSLIGCDVETKFDPNIPQNPDRPRAWIETRGTLHISGGAAIIRGSAGQDT